MGHPSSLGMLANGFSFLFLASASQLIHALARSHVAGVAFGLGVSWGTGDEPGASARWGW